MRSGLIDYLKLLLTLFIAYFHFAAVTGGTIVVEFFCLISGVFLFIGLEKPYEPYQYLKKRFKRFFPYTFAAWLFALFVVRYLPVILGESSFTFKKFITWMSTDIWEAILIGINGMWTSNGATRAINGVYWMLCGLFVVEYFLACIHYFWKRKLTDFLIPLTIFIGYGYWGHRGGADWNEPFGPVSFGILMVVLPVCLSYYVYLLMKRIKASNYTRLGANVLSVVEVLLYGLCLTATLTLEYNIHYIWLLTFVMMIPIAITISGKSTTARIVKSNRISNYLAKLSIGIYLTHPQIIKIYQRIYPDEAVRQAHLVSYFVSVLIFAVLFVHIVDIARKVFSNLWQKTKYTLLEARR